MPWLRAWDIFNCSRIEHRGDGSHYIRIFLIGYFYSASSSPPQRCSRLQQWHCVGINTPKRNEDMVEQSSYIEIDKLHFVCRCSIRRSNQISYVWWHIFTLIRIDCGTPECRDFDSYVTNALSRVFYVELARSLSRVTHKAYSVKQSTSLREIWRRAWSSRGVVVE